MKMKALELLRNFRNRLSRSRRWLFVIVITLLLIPSSTRADGIGDILSLFHTITSTLQGPIGGALSEMRKVTAAVNNFRQEIIWPLAVINQTRSFVSATRARYTGLMSQIEGIKNNSATLALPIQLESMFRGAQSGSIGQLPAIYTQVYQPVALVGIAQPGQRNLMDIDDAMAMDSLKTSMVSDQTTQGMLTLADSLEQQAMSAAPGSASMVTAQARVASCNAGAARENARRSTAPGSNQTGAPECDAQAQRHNDAKSFQPDPASSSSSIRSSKNEIANTLSSLEVRSKCSGHGMRCGCSSCAASQQGSQPART